MDNFNAPSPKPVKRRSSKLDRFKPEIDSWLRQIKESAKAAPYRDEGYNRLRKIQEEQYS